MDSELLIKIITKSISGIASSAELEQLKAWIGNDTGRKELIEQLHNTKWLNDYRNLRRRISSEAAYSEMMRRLGIAKKKRRLHRISIWGAAAASVAAIYLIVSFLRPFTDITTSADTERAVLVSVEQLHPGDSKATLTLANGSQVQLNGDKPLLASEINDKKPDSKVAGNKELCLEVPRGGEFIVVLEDSTRVWLNSSSKLIYPEHFDKGSRHVSIEGEAYFEVAHDCSRPFYVEVPGAQFVKVYGTEFNIRSYPEDPEVRTTLCSGSISLSQAEGSGGEIFLSPGHQAVFDKTTRSARLRTADIDRVSGWRNGRFVFEDQSLYQIMLDLSRWYDFDFEFADNSLKETIFMGSIPRYSNFTTAIAILEKSGGLKFEIADNKVVISKKEKSK